MKQAEAESRVTYTEKDLENARLDFDNERCENNREVFFFSFLLNRLNKAN